MVRVRQVAPLFVIVAAAIAAACSSGASSSPETRPVSNDGITNPDAADAGTDASTPLPKPSMNDVSVLLPLPASATELDLPLGPSAEGRGGALLSKALYEAATNGDSEPEVDPLPNAPVTFPYESLRLVAFRLDPCFAGHVPPEPGEACDAQLRLVFQPLRADAAGVKALDAALHVFYSLSRSDWDAALGEIVAARVASGRDASGPLRVHPVVAEEGLGGKTAKAFFATVVRYAGAATLTRFTRFRAGNAGALWMFSGFDIAKGASTPMIIPTLPEAAKVVSFSDPSNGEVRATLTPTSASPDNIDLFADLNRATNATDGARKAAYDALLRIENPAHHSPNTIDCASCHVAELARVAVAEAHFGLSEAGNPNAFRPDERAVPLADVARSTPKPTADQFSMHAFSYKGPAPGISQRVIHETAAVVAALTR